MLLTPEGELGNGQSLSGELNSRLTLGEPSQMMIPTPAGNIYQVERTLTFNTNGSDTDTYTCMASNINAVQPNATRNFTLFVQGRSRDMRSSAVCKASARIYLPYAVSADITGNVVLLVSMFRHCPARTLFNLRVLCDY